VFPDVRRKAELNQKNMRRTLYYCDSLWLACTAERLLSREQSWSTAGVLQGEQDSDVFVPNRFDFFKFNLPKINRVLILVVVHESVPNTPSNSLYCVLLGLKQSGQATTIGSYVWVTHQVKFA